MFKNKKDGALVVLTVIMWIFAVVFACVTDYNAEPTPWTLYLFGVFLALAIVLSVFSVRAYKKSHPRQDKVSGEFATPDADYKQKEKESYIRPEPSLLDVILPGTTSKQRRALSNSDIEKAAIIYAANGASLIADCVRLVDTTSNPETFFKRLDCLGERLQNNAVIEEKFPKLFKANQREQYARFRSEYTATVNAFIDRVFLPVQELKTEKSRKENAKRKYEALLKFSAQMTPESIDYLRAVFYTAEK